MTIARGIRQMDLLTALVIAGGLLFLLGVVNRNKWKAAAIIPTAVGLIFLGMAFVAWFAGEQLFPAVYDNPQALADLQNAKLTSQPAVNASADWWQWRGPNRDGTVTNANLRSDWASTAPKTMWSAPCGTGYSSVVVAEGRVYVHDRNGDEERLQCLDANDGSLKWTYSYPANYTGFTSHPTGPRATPAVFDGRVYIVSSRGRFVCLEATPTTSEPKVLWEHELLAEYAAPLPSWGVACSPLIEEDLVIVQPGGRKGTVVAFDRKSGEPRWTSMSEGTGYSSPSVATIAGKRLVIAFAARALHGIDAVNGRLQWSYPWVTQFDNNITMPIIADDHIFISTGYSAGCAMVHIKADDKGKLRVERVFERRGRLLMTKQASGVLRDGFVYGFDESRGELKCINLRDPKEEVWSSSAVRSGNVTLVDSMLLVQTEDGTLALVEATPEEFRLRAKLPNLLSGGECWALPAVVGGKIYLRDGEKVVCLDSAK